MAFIIDTVIKQIAGFIPKKWKVREETKAQGEAQLAVAAGSVRFWQERMGWSPEAARYLATAFAFGIRENAASVLGKAQELSLADDFSHQFLRRAEEDASIIGAVVQASRFTASDDLRDLLGRILAGDIDDPGSISRRTVSVAEDLSSLDLQEFLKLRSATWVSEELDVRYTVLVLGERTGLYGTRFLSFDSEKIGIDFHAFGEFQSLGLLQERAHGIGLRWEDVTQKAVLSYGGKRISLTPTNVDSNLQLGIHMFTKAGMEIMELFIDDKCVELEGYFEEVCQYWQQNGIDVVVLED